jgi:hypothetical protein
MTDNEYAEIWREVSGGSDEGQPRAGVEYALLRRIADGAYGTTIIEPSEVPALAEECQRFKATEADVALQDAIERIASVCRSAIYYHSRLYVPRGRDTVGLIDWDHESAASFGVGQQRP